MAYLHSHSVLHGDLTPSNILLSAAAPAARGADAADAADGDGAGGDGDTRGWAAMVG